MYHYLPPPSPPTSVDARHQFRDSSSLGLHQDLQPSSNATPGIASAMSSMTEAEHEAFEQQLKDVIQDLYQIMIQVATYDTTGRPGREVLSEELKTLSHSIKSIHEVSSSPTTNLPLVPPELLDYVESGRNPDIYTREFTELTRRGNQLMRGKALAFGDFRDVLAREISTAMPELRGDVERVVEETGGRRTVANGKKGGLWNGRGSGDDSEGDGSESGSGNGNESEVGTGMGARIANGNRMGNGNGNGNGSRNGVAAGSALAGS
ncbi:hypothetical protein E4U19_002230 [Claviceps sp. Clav32 group G5]|nr:hypothetical protein E4U19_002230 [Claviceps sp. Clav32 group G5]